MLIDKRTAVVDLIVNDHVQVLLGVVIGDLLEGEFLIGGHCDGSLMTWNWKAVISYTGLRILRKRNMWSDFVANGLLQRWATFRRANGGSERGIRAGLTEKVDNNGRDRRWKNCGR